MDYARQKIAEAIGQAQQVADTLGSDSTWDDLSDPIQNLARAGGILMPGMTPQAVEEEARDVLDAIRDYLREKIDAEEAAEEEEEEDEA